MAVLHIYLYYLVLKQSTDVDIIVIPNLQKKKLKLEEMKQVGSNKGSGIGSHVYLMQNLAFLARVRPYYTVETRGRPNNQNPRLIKGTAEKTEKVKLIFGIVMYSWPPSPHSYPKPLGISSHPDLTLLSKKYLDLI